MFKRVCSADYHSWFLNSHLIPLNVWSSEVLESTTKHIFLSLGTLNTFCKTFSFELISNKKQWIFTTSLIYMYTVEMSQCSSVWDLLTSLFDWCVCPLFFLYISSSCYLLIRFFFDSLKISFLFVLVDVLYLLPLWPQLSGSE